MVAKIEVSGLRELQTSLRQMDRDTPKMMRLVLNRAVDEVIDYARPRIPRDSGAAAGSLKARSSQREARIAFGGRRAPHAPWLDFGGQGRRRGRPPARRYIAGGRYVWRGLEQRRDRVVEIMSDGLAELGRSSGLEVT